MAGSRLYSDAKYSRRRWIVGILTFLTFAVLVTSFTHYRRNYYGEMSFPTSHVDPEFTKDLRIKEFIKPEGVKIIGLVFFGRKNRVEILRCFLEVSCAGSPG